MGIVDTGSGLRKARSLHGSVPDRIRPWGMCLAFKGYQWWAVAVRSAHQGSDYTSGYIPRGRYEKLTLWTVS